MTESVNRRSIRFFLCSTVLHPISGLDLLEKSISDSESQINAFKTCSLVKGLPNRITVILQYSHTHTHINISNSDSFTNYVLTITIRSISLLRSFEAIAHISNLTKNMNNLYVIFRKVRSRSHSLSVNRYCWYLLQRPLSWVFASNSVSEECCAFIVEIQLITNEVYTLLNIQRIPQNFPKIISHFNKLKMFYSILMNFKVL